MTPFLTIFDHVDAPNRVTVDLSTDANNTLQIAVDPHDQFPSWRMDVRIVHGSKAIVDVIENEFGLSTSSL